MYTIAFCNVVGVVIGVGFALVNIAESGCPRRWNISEILPLVARINGKKPKNHIIVINLRVSICARVCRHAEMNNAVIMYERIDVVMIDVIAMMERS